MKRVRFSPQCRSGRGVLSGDGVCGPPGGADGGVGAGGDPLWHCDQCCHCGCRRMPRELSGGFCLHCSHVYQRNDPEFWLGEEFPHSEAAHLKSCASYQEYHQKTEEGLAKFRAMSKGADEETFSKLLSACYSRAIDDNYEAYMSSPEGSAERAAIVERIAAANAQEIAARQRELDEAFGKNGE